jgi:hypothetical protein
MTWVHFAWCACLCTYINFTRLLKQTSWPEEMFVSSLSCCIFSIFFGSYLSRVWQHGVGGTTMTWGRGWWRGVVLYDGPSTFLSRRRTPPSRSSVLPPPPPLIDPLLGKSGPWGLLIMANQSTVRSQPLCGRSTEGGSGGGGLSAPRLYTLVLGHGLERDPLSERPWPRPGSYVFNVHICILKETV